MGPPKDCVRMPRDATVAQLERKSVISSPIVYKQNIPLVRFYAYKYRNRSQLTSSTTVPRPNSTTAPNVNHTEAYRTKVCRSCSFWRSVTLISTKTIGPRLYLDRTLQNSTILN